ncbi:MAG: mechanosensitive ion channel [Deltaproteobacteria bacterium]|jgi:potassium-dependent mechanosensitive channel|nr:mechanosensitive ion channel [Deltaproteobacteria bacterium]
MSMDYLSFSGNRQKAAVFAASLIFCFLFLVVTPAPSWSAEAQGVEQTVLPPMDGLPDLTVPALEERIRIAKAAPKLSPESKERIVTFYQKAIDSLMRREKAMARVSEYAATLKELPHPKDLPRGQVKPVRTAAVEERAKAMALVEIEGEIAGLHVQLAEAQTQLESKQQKLQDLLTRPAQLRRSIAQYEQTLSELQEKLARPKPEDELPRLIRARRTSLRAQQSALEAQLKVADREVVISKREMAVTQNQQALFTRKVHRLETLIKTWESVREHRQSDVGYIEMRQNQESLRQMALENWPKAGAFLKELGEQNLALSETLIQLDTREQEADKTAKLLETRLNQTQKDFELTGRRVKMMGLTRKAAQWLQSRRETLRKSRANPRVASQRRNEILRVSLASDEMIQERQDYLVLKNKIYDQLDNLEPSLSPKQNEVLTMQAFLLLESKRRLFEETGKSYINYLKKLNAQETAQKKLDILAEEYRDFINERLLWTQSVDLISPSDAIVSEKVISWLFSPANWRKFFRDLGLSVGSRPAIWGLLVLGLLMVIFSKPRIRRNIKSHGEKSSTEGMGGTLVLMLWIVIQTAGIPIILYLAAIHLRALPTGDYFTRAVCSGLAVTLVAVIFLKLTVQLCRKGGLGRSHFLWNEPVCGSMVRSARTLLLLFVPLLFFAVMIQNGPQAQGFRSSLGRLLFLLSMVPMLLVLWRSIGKSSPLAKAVREGRPDRWLSKYLPFWSTLVLLCPVALMVLTILGYYFTAYQLAWSLTEMAWLVLVLVLVNAIMLRGLRAAQAKLALQKAVREQEEAARKAREANEDPEESIQSTPQISAPALDLQEINEQTSMLIRSVTLVVGFIGLWFIWADVFPAFRFLDNVALWTQEIGVDKAGTPILKSITLLNVIIAVIIFVATYIAVKSGTALLEILLAKSSKLDAGSQQSFGLIFQYAIFMVGLFAGLNALGIGWKQFQWLAAAMTVGLSFGLKDIFANFVSGIIILFERPIRLGDTVTVAGSSGKVSRIRIRSTTITDWDRRELIVPNQAFLSEKITNWSLSDKVRRVVIDVGIGYGSDAKKAEELLLKIAKEDRLVLDNPGPSVYFEGFGADSLDFKLRVFVPLSDAIKVQNQIRHRINQMFQEAGIEIPFAQRDVHMDTGSGPLDIRLLNDGVGAAPCGRPGNG